MLFSLQTNGIRCFLVLRAFHLFQSHLKTHKMKGGKTIIKMLTTCLNKRALEFIQLLTRMVVRKDTIHKLTRTLKYTCFTNLNRHVDTRACAILLPERGVGRMWIMIICFALGMVIVGWDEFGDNILNILSQHPFFI